MQKLYFAKTYQLLSKLLNFSTTCYTVIQWFDLNKREAKPSSRIYPTYISLSIKIFKPNLLDFRSLRIGVAFCISLQFTTPNCQSPLNKNILHFFLLVQRKEKKERRETNSKDQYVPFSNTYNPSITASKSTRIIRLGWQENPTRFSKTREPRIGNENARRNEIFLEIKVNAVANRSRVDWGWERGRKGVDSTRIFIKLSQ